MIEGGILFAWGSFGLARSGNSRVPVELTEFRGSEILEIFMAHDNVFILSE